FHLSNQHFLSRPPIEDAHFVSAEAESGTRGIQSYIAASDNSHTAPNSDWLANFHIS
ncbi:unnamed protein product, partial [marine sediment metagenome]